MSAVLSPPPRRHAISTAEYLRMADAGVFAPDSRLELIDGVIIDMPPIASPHAGTVNVAARVLWPLAEGLAIVSVQNATVPSPPENFQSATPYPFI